MQTIRREVRQKIEQAMQEWSDCKLTPVDIELVEKITDAVLTVRGVRKVPEGLPEPTGDVIGDWLKMDHALMEKNMKYIVVCETLANEFHYNFPKFGENQSWDRAVKLIAKDGRDVKEFVKWAKEKKRDPHWYHIKPDTMWGDFPQAFEREKTFAEKLAEA